MSQVTQWIIFGGVFVLLLGFWVFVLSDESLCGLEDAIDEIFEDEEGC
ncbi:MAG TPA: hypothetical protein VHL10_01725 [Nitrososphaera sp.]|jgi:hypothetical protein|nr:hypothetical protein [Nitrososphaera sp.]